MVLLDKFCDVVDFSIHHNPSGVLVVMFGDFSETEGFGSEAVGKSHDTTYPTRPCAQAAAWSVRTAKHSSVVSRFAVNFRRCSCIESSTASATAL